MNMWTIRKILVAADFSEPAAAALEHAVALAATSGASVYVVHTFEFPVYGFYGAPFAVPIADYSDAMEKAAGARLEAFRRTKGRRTRGHRRAAAGLRIGADPGRRA